MTSGHLLEEMKDNSMMIRDAYEQSNLCLLYEWSKEVGEALRNLLWPTSELGDDTISYLRHSMVRRYSKTVETKVSSILRVWSRSSIIAERCSKHRQPSVQERGVLLVGLIATLLLRAAGVSIRLVVLWLLTMTLALAVAYQQFRS